MRISPVEDAGRILIDQLPEVQAMVSQPPHRFDGANRQAVLCSASDKTGRVQVTRPEGGFTPTLIAPMRR